MRQSARTRTFLTGAQRPPPPPPRGTLVPPPQHATPVRKNVCCGLRDGHPNTHAPRKEKRARFNCSRYAHTTSQRLPTTPAQLPGHKTSILKQEESSTGIKVFLGTVSHRLLS